MTRKTTGLSRREALKLLGGLAGAGLVRRFAWAQAGPLLRRPIPVTGELLPAVGLGTWRVFDVGDSASARDPLMEVLETLAGGGGSVIDSSPMYGRSEEVVGDLMAAGDLRERMFVATKVWTSGAESGR